MPPTYPAPGGPPLRTGDGISPDEPGREGGAGLFGIATMLLAHWRAVAAGLAAGLLLGMLYIFLLPDVYAAHVVLVPSRSDRGPGALSAQLPAGLIGLTGMGGGEEQKQILAIARSRTIADSVYSRVDETPTPGERELFIAQMGDRMEMALTADGSWVVEIRHQDPELAAEIANHFPPLLNLLSADMQRQAIATKREFLESQLIEAAERLIAAEENMLAYQRQTAAPAIQEQSRQTVEAAGELQRQIMAREVEVARLARTATAENPQLRAARADVAALRAQLRSLTRGGSGSEVYVGLREAPEIQVGEVRRMREFATQEQIYLALTASLAETQIDVRTHMPVVSVLDPATVPDESTRLKPWIALMLSLWVGLMMGIALALVLEYLERARDGVEYPRFRAALARVGVR